MLLLQLEYVPYNWSSDRALTNAHSHAITKCLITVYTTVTRTNCKIMQSRISGRATVTRNGMTVNCYITDSINLGMFLKILLNQTVWLIESGKIILHDNLISCHRQ